jgi:hypothetical protein
MDRARLLHVLEQVREGRLAVADAAERLRTMPFEELEGLAVIDHHRSLRSGIPEVVLGETKHADDIATILSRLAADGSGAMATRVGPEKAGRVLELAPGARYYELARAVVMAPATTPDRGRGTVVVASAGTSDRPVAEEAAVTLEFLGHRVDRVTDIGVAGLHRLVAKTERLRAAEVAIVIAGMEGALPSVVAGLIDRPVIAVPTSVGYGVGLGGFVAMLGMLSSCSPGITVVNIDNGFGAAVAAALINQRRDA